MAQVMNAMYCPMCGKRLMAGSKACPYCGWTSVQQQAATTPPPAATVPPPVAVQQPVYYAQQPVYQQPVPPATNAKPKLNTVETMLAMLVSMAMAFFIIPSILVAVGSTDTGTNYAVSIVAGLIIGSIIRAVALSAKKQTP